MARTERQRIESSRSYATETNYSEHLEYFSLDENKAELKFSLATYGEKMVDFHKRYWNEIDQVNDPIMEFLQWADNKNDIAEQFRAFYRVKNKLGYDSPKKAQNDYIKSLGFTESQTSTWRDKFTHKLKVSELKDLFRQTAEKHFKKEMKEYKEYRKLFNQRTDDIKNRKIFIDRVKFFHEFIEEFELRNRSFNSDIERIQLSIGRGDLESLAGPRDDYRYSLYPRHARKSAFRAMEYAKEWLKVYQPIIEELDRLKIALNAPNKLDNMGYDNQVFTKWRHVDIIKLANFDYQGFLTFLLDFRHRFGKIDNRLSSYDSLSGFKINERDHNGDYLRRRYRADEWNVFECKTERDNYRNTTFNQYLDKMIQRGEIYTISSAGRMSEIVEYTNRNYHDKNISLGRYEKTPLIRVKVSDEQDAEAGRWKL